MPPSTLDLKIALLLEQVDRLSEPECLVFHILALADEPLIPTALLQVCTEAGMIPRNTSTGKPVRSLSPYQANLRVGELLTEKNVVDPIVQEPVVRRLYTDQPDRARTLARAIRTVLPVAAFRIYLSQREQISICHRIRRDLRLALMEGNNSGIETGLDLLRQRCSSLDGFEHPLIPILCSPFDPAWFATLPPLWQIRFLSWILSNSGWHLTTYPGVTDYALNPPALPATVPPEERVAFTHNLITHLLLAARIADARRLLTEVLCPLTGNFSAGLSGWLALIEGRPEDAVAAFEADLKELRQRQRKRTLFFHDWPAPFFLLALLRRGDAGSLAKADEYFDRFIRLRPRDAAITNCMQALRYLLGNQKGDPPESGQRVLTELLGTRENNRTGLEVFFACLALFAIAGRLERDQIALLNRFLLKARAAGQDWLAMEYAQLLCRADKETADRRDFLATVRASSGLVPLSAGVHIEEPWQKSLRALKMALQEGAVKTAREPTGTPQTRIVYLLGFSKKGSLETIAPLEQRLSTKGVWSKGRPVALQRLAQGEKCEGLTDADRPLQTAIRRVEYYYNHHWEFNLQRVLPALVGHPLLFLAESPTTPVEVLKGEPEVLVQGKGKKLTVRFLPETATEERYVLVREIRTRYRVVELSETHRRLVRILGTKGLTLPDSAQEEMAQILASMASLVTVHSTIPGTAHSVETVTADSMPRMHLVPHGNGFRLEMLVRPLAPGGPYLRPGQGAKNLMADVEGRRCQAERDLREETLRASNLERSLPSLAALPEMDGQWFPETPEEALQVLLELREAQDRGDTLVEWPEGEKLKLGRPVSFADLHLRLRGATNWFEVGGGLRLDEERVLDIQELLALLKTTPHRFLPLGEGQFVALSRELRKRLDELAAYADRRGKKVGVHPLAALALEDFTHQVGNLDADPQWYERLTRIREGLTLTPRPPSTLKAQLRDYQKEGFQWLARLAHLGFGACLADDMGLGKTVQTLAAILHRAPEGPTLVVAPTSVCANWLAEARRFAPTLNLVPFGGTDRQARVADLGPFDVVVASYGLLHQESALLTAVDWQTVVLDEAQAIKNAATKRAQAAMHLKAPFKVVTTGTPIENHLGEFWTLFNFINPGLLGSRERFNTRFAGPIERENDREASRRLKKLVQPFILRRLKSQVLEELPPRTEVVLEVELSREETALYEALRRKALERIEAEEGANGQKPMRILAEITRLRQACCHPRLILPESELAGAKLTLFGEVVTELLENGHKALVFSQFVGHLNLIRAYLDARAVPYRYLDGSTPPRERQREVEAFQAGQGDLFLISLKAGGLGLNLTAADYVIHMDPWWNPAVEDQASDRAHRIGQQRPVTVYRLVTRNTIEEKIVRLHAEKRDLADSLLDETDASAKISAEELLRLIREP